MQQCRDIIAVRGAGLLARKLPNWTVGRGGSLLIRDCWRSVHSRRTRVCKRKRWGGRVEVRGPPIRTNEDPLETLELRGALSPQGVRPWERPSTYDPQHGHVEMVWGWGCTGRGERLCGARPFWPCSRLCPLCVTSRHPLKPPLSLVPLPESNEGIFASSRGYVVPLSTALLMACTSQS